ncbi:uncharacterized protein CC84DRAFT_1176010 [Paraphaeosphaeria sporulosa]|uniref:Zn(2)-C6 fungal-type domain-containing protein n=1 Tax=Paraphaeosphaeria sporulosa TaxID=1460663 RepID=A0A177CGF9_9PLEO|nr:uncharacterized protein CC84DRAFT_1176010 [Paraphaeosphaeria sporulosa]OAG05918.1 hypothetical protein CC84DRAFT_1176010 [Paraphaeosphaeria sporulosa]
MASQPYPLANMAVSAAVDPAFWTQPQQSADSSPLALHLSPSASSTTHDSQQSNTPPALTPKSDNERKNSATDQQNGQQGAQNGNQARTSVAVACVQCRSRHLKCDGGVRCSRCRADGVDCTYIKSRRGWKGKRKKPGENGAPVPVPDPNALPSGPVLNTNLTPTSHQALSPEYAFANELALANQLNSPHTIGLVTPPSATSQLNLNGSQRLNKFGHLGPPTPIQAFYHYFYNSHPFCVPQLQLMQLFKDRRAPLLEYAVQYLGSCYLAEMPTDMYKEALNRTIDSGQFPRDGFSVQALILYAVGLHACNEVPRSAQIFGLVQNLVVELGMNRMDYALIHGNNDRVLEESWRRTWWSSYTVNGMLTAVNPGVQFRLKDIATDVPLPCEDHQYFSGAIPYPHTLQEYDDSAFAPEEIIFSSFTYLIDAIRILGKVFEVARLDSQFEYHAVDVVDSYLVNWRLHLPANKLEIVNNDGVIDEVLFQAHMVNAGSTIMLHRPRSNLGFGRVENVNICVQPGQVLLPTQTREIHTAKCLTSAENISSLIKLPGQLIYHTPFFTCVVVMASVVHLSYWSFLVPDGQDDIIKQSIRLDVGTLQQYSHTWDIAHVVLGQVRGVAHTLWNSKKAMSIHLWNNIAGDEVIRNVIEEGATVPVQQYNQLIAPMLKS